MRIIPILACLFLAHGEQNGTTLSIVKIYSNFAEIIRQVSDDQLPIEFSSGEWSDIRSDTITLFGNNIVVTSQTITEKKGSLNGERIYIRQSTTDQSITTVPAIMIDEKRNLVQDLTLNSRYYTVTNDRIEYGKMPPTDKYIVSFTYVSLNNTDGQFYISYLRSNLNWKTRYNLMLYNDGEKQQKTVLIGYADIRNNGVDSVVIESAELFGGDVNIRLNSPQQQYSTEYNRNPAASLTVNLAAASTFAPSISSAEELAGVYVFNIDKPFTIESKTNYVLPMLQPIVQVERYASISKAFDKFNTRTRGKAQRSYRLRSNQFLAKGSVILRESDRLVGESTWPDIAANDSYEFSIGTDPDIVYKENVTLLSTDKAMEQRYYSNRSSYEINLKLKNFKKRPIKVEYTQKFYSLQFTLEDKTSKFIRDGSDVNAKFSLQSDEEKDYQYRIEIIE